MTPGTSSPPASRPSSPRASSWSWCTSGYTRWPKPEPEACRERVPGRMVSRKLRMDWARPPPLSPPREGTVTVSARLRPASARSPSGGRLRMETWRRAPPQRAKVTSPSNRTPRGPRRLAPRRAPSPNSPPASPESVTNPWTCSPPGGNDAGAPWPGKRCPRPGRRGSHSSWLWSWGCLSCAGSPSSSATACMVCAGTPVRSQTRSLSSSSGLATVTAPWTRPSTPSSTGTSGEPFRRSSASPGKSPFKAWGRTAAPPWQS